MMFFSLDLGQTMRLLVGALHFALHLKVVTAGMHYVRDDSSSASCGWLNGTTNSTGIANPPKTYGMLLFRGFDPLDVFGPLEALQSLSHRRQLNLYLISETLDAVSSAPQSASMNLYNSSFFPTVNPTHTLTTVPSDMEVLLIPGGAGTRATDINDTIAYIATVYPKLRYLITVCTGAGLAAKAGVLDGRHATTNKAAWATMVSWGPKVHWVAPARWVVDGNIWTSSGVSAGIDATLAFINEMYGSANLTYVVNQMEYERHPASWDPFAAIFNATSTG